MSTGVKLKQAVQNAPSENEMTIDLYQFNILVNYRHIFLVKRAQLFWQHISKGPEKHSEANKHQHFLVSKQSEMKSFTVLPCFI